MIGRFLNSAPSLIAAGGAYCLLLGIVFYRGFFLALHLQLFDFLSLTDYVTVIADIVFVGVFLAAIIALVQMGFFALMVLVEPPWVTGSPVSEKIRHLAKRCEAVQIKPLARTLTIVLLFALLSLGFMVMLHFEVSPIPERDAVFVLLRVYAIFAALLLIFGLTIYFFVLSHVADRRIFLGFLIFVFPVVATLFFGYYFGISRLTQGREDVTIVGKGPVRSFVMLMSLDKGVLVLDRKTRIVSLIKWDNIDQISLLNPLPG